MSAVELRVDARIATLLLNRPDHLNAFNDEMESGIIDALDDVDADDSVRAVIITGAGRAFCAGADLAGGARSFTAWRSSPTAPAGTQFNFPSESLPVRRDGGGRVSLRIFRCNKPVIAAINGPAVGVGATMTLACDVRLASESARFGFVFGRIGLAPEACSSWFLPRIVSMQTALEWVLTGRVFSAAEASRTGLVRDVYATEDDLLLEATDLAREIAENSSPVSAALTRQLMWRMLAAPGPMDAHVAETLALNSRGVSRDAEEGIAAFLEKRRATFRDAVSTDLPDVFGKTIVAEFDPRSLELS